MKSKQDNQLPENNPEESLLTLGFDAFFGPKEKQDAAQNKLFEHSSVQYVVDGPRFFERFQSGSDLFWTWSAPVVEPLVFGIVVGIAATIASIALVIAVGSLLFAAAAAVCMEKNAAGSAIDLALKAGVVAGLATLGTLVVSFMALVRPPYNLIKAITRTGATIAHHISAPSPEDDDYMLPETSIPSMK